MSMNDAHARLTAIFSSMGNAALAVSGGVDSMTLAHIAVGSGARIQVFHAISPAVPGHATDRVRIHAKDNGWDLHVVGAGEFDDPAYHGKPCEPVLFLQGKSL